MTDTVREKFEKEYSSGDLCCDAISLARREDGEYEQALARMCFKWFCKGGAAHVSGNFIDELELAKQKVLAYPLFKKFIAGTPLENDIPVWIAEASVKQSAQADARVERERARALVGEMIKYTNHTYHCPATISFENDCTCKLHECEEKAQAFMEETK